MTEQQKNKSWLEKAGCAVSAWVADKVAHPFAQIGVIALCALWWTFKLPTDILTATLSIMAITLTQMVLNNQYERELDVHRRDVAMHTKLDELIAASKRAKNDFVGIEEREEEEIVQLKEEVKEAIEESPGATPQVRETAERAVDHAADAMRKGREDAAREQADARRPRPRKGAAR